MLTCDDSTPPSPCNSAIEASRTCRGRHALSSANAFDQMRHRRRHRNGRSLWFAMGAERHHAVTG
jgi:hypothetical protein